MQTSRTICAHNAPGQVVRTDYPTSCRQCGTLIQGTPRAATSTGQHIASEKETNAIYPADSKTADRTFAFTQ